MASCQWQLLPERGASPGLCRRSHEGQRSHETAPQRPAPDEWRGCDRWPRHLGRSSQTPVKQVMMIHDDDDHDDSIIIFPNTLLGEVAGLGILLGPLAPSRC